MNVQKAKDARKAAYAVADECRRNGIARTAKMAAAAIHDAEVAFLFAERVLHARKKEAIFNERAEYRKTEDQYNRDIDAAEAVYSRIKAYDVLREAHARNWSAADAKGES